MEKHANTYIKLGKKDNWGKVHHITIYLDTDYHELVRQLHPREKDKYLRVFLAAGPGDELVAMKYLKSEVETFGKIENVRKK